jgi:transcriptional regulator with XRE-family HTH domain
MKTNKPESTKARRRNALDTVLEEITPQEQERTEKRMLLAAKIDEGRSAKGWNQNQFAEAMGKQPSEISKWLSGTHNFTAETLWDIEEQLGIELIALKEPASKVVRLMEVRTEVSAPVHVRSAALEIYNRTTTNKADVESDVMCYG